MPGRCTRGCTLHFRDMSVRIRIYHILEMGIIRILEMRIIHILQMPTSTIRTCTLRTVHNPYSRSICTLSTLNQTAVSQTGGTIPVEMLADFHGSKRYESFLLKRIATATTAAE